MSPRLIVPMCDYESDYERTSPRLIVPMCDYESDYEVNYEVVSKRTPASCCTGWRGAHATPCLGRGRLVGGLSDGVRATGVRATGPCSGGTRCAIPCPVSPVRCAHKCELGQPSQSAAALLGPGARRATSDKRRVTATWKDRTTSRRTRTRDEGHLLGDGQGGGGQEGDVRDGDDGGE